MIEPIIKISNLCKSFGGTKATNDVSFVLKHGEALGIIGPNGSGKSTLINLISGFVKPDKGQILFKGINITGMAPHKLLIWG